jgi:hypothetical protein
MLNIFYEEPEGDRWFPWDRYPRRMLRRIVRGRPLIGGQQRVFVNLCAGLDRLGAAYRVNDYRHLRRHPDELACVVGKPHVLDKLRWGNPILFGSAVFSHPTDDPQLFERLPVQRMLVPGDWMRQMCEPYYGNRVTAWPTGIDVDRWSPASEVSKDIDILLYDKVRWRHDEIERTLIAPVRRVLDECKLRYAVIRYGYYREHDFRQLLARSRAMVFLCEHETQGFAYQQALACGVPILAWDRGGYWQDPKYFPDIAKFRPVSSAPYWDARCGLKFLDANDFPQRLDEFWPRVAGGDFSPRDYIVEHLTLEQCSGQYLEIVSQVLSQL